MSEIRHDSKKQLIASAVFLAALLVQGCGKKRTAKNICKKALSISRW